MFSTTLKTDLACLANNECTNLGFRIANLIQVMSGNNKFAPLSYYSNHMEQYLDEVPVEAKEILDGVSGEKVAEKYNVDSDNRVLRGAIGPRIMNWVGSHQLQEANDFNSEVNDDEEFIKPSGVNQLMQVFRDLYSGMTSSTVIVRDPSIDFDSSNDVPDLISVSFSVKETYSDTGESKRLLSVEMIFEELDCEGTNTMNTVWFFIMLSKMYTEILDIDSSQISVNCPMYGLKTFPWSEMFGPSENETLFTNDVQLFLVDLVGLEKVDMAVRSSFKEDSFDSDQISMHYICDSIEENLISKMNLDVSKDMAYCLLIFGLSKGGKDYHPNIQTIMKKLRTVKFITEAEAFWNSLNG